MQIKAGFKKEWQLFTRTGKIIGVVLAIWAFAIFDPVMWKVLSYMTDMMSDMSTTIATESGAEISEGENEISENTKPLITANIITFASGADSPETIIPPLSSSDEEYIEQQLQSSIDLMGEMTGMMTIDYIFMATVTEFFGASILIILLVMMTAAGGEMKKRSTIIPNCSGLNPFSYIIPKFIFYPLFTFLVTFSGTFLAYFMCSALFEGTLPIEAVFASATTASFYLMFIVVCMLTLGICTSKAGVATIVIFISSSFIPIILASLEMEKFNPFALRTLALYAPTSNVSDGEFMTNMLVSILITIALCVGFFFLTGLVLKARKINNLGEEKPHF